MLASLQSWRRWWDRLPDSLSRPRLFIALLATPLLFIPDLESLSRYLQLWATVGLVTIGLIVHRHQLGQEWQHLARFVRWGALALVGAIILTWLVSVSTNQFVGYMGYQPEYFGYVAWLTMLAAALLFGRPASQLIQQPASRLVGSAILVVSLLVDQYNIRHGLPVQGVFYSPIVLAIVAVVVTGLFLSKLTKPAVSSGWSVAGCLLGLITVVVSQQAVGWVALLIVMLLWSCFQPLPRGWRIGAFLVATLLITLPILAPGWLSGIRQANLKLSWQYTTHLARQTVLNLGPSKMLYGRGAATIPQDINSQNWVPADIKRSLDLPFRLFGNHNLYYDIYYLFGSVACLAVLAGTFWILTRLRGQWARLSALVLSWTGLFIYQLTFPPNLYVTSLWFIMTAALLQKPAPQSGGRTLHLWQWLGLGGGLLGSVALLSLPPLHKVSTEAFNPPVNQLSQPINQVLRSRLRERLAASRAPRGSALLLNARTGQIMATADVANADRTVCQATLACDYPIGNAVWRAWEPGSVMKPLLVAAALNEHRTSLQDRFVDDQVVKVKDRLFLDATTHQLETIRNQDVLNLSRNTGAVHIYHTLGTNQQAQNTWHQYLTQHYQLGQVIPGVGPNDRGAVRDARGGRNLEVQLTGSSFGIGLTATPLQVAAAYAALVNGGQYVQPHFGTAAASHRQILQPDTSRQMIASLQEVLHQNNAAAEHPGFIMGAKSGTGPATAEDGTYKLTLDNGAYVGFVGRQRPEYILLVKIAEPKTYEFASFAARDAWTDIINDLLSKQLLFH